MLLEYYWTSSMQETASQFLVVLFAVVQHVEEKGYSFLLPAWEDTYLYVYLKGRGVVEKYIGSHRRLETQKNGILGGSMVGFSRA